VYGVTPVLGSQIFLKKFVLDRTRARGLVSLPEDSQLGLRRCFLTGFCQDSHKGNPYNKMEERWRRPFNNPSDEDALNRAPAWLDLTRTANQTPTPRDARSAAHNGAPNGCSEPTTRRGPLHPRALRTGGCGHLADRWIPSCRAPSSSPPGDCCMDSWVAAPFSITSSGKSLTSPPVAHPSAVPLLAPVGLALRPSPMPSTTATADTPSAVDAY
jgi:hypothetical protein